MTHKEAVLYVKEKLNPNSELVQIVISTLEDLVEYREAPREKKIPMPCHIQCSRCGKTVSENDHKDTFCIHCGQRLTNLPIM